MKEDMKNACKELPDTGQRVPWQQQLAVAVGQASPASCYNCALVFPPTARQRTTLMSVSYNY